MSSQKDLQGIDAGGTSNVQLEFARLQMELAASTKDQTAEQINQVQKLQNEQREVSMYLRMAMTLQNSARQANTSIQMPGDMKNYMDQNKLKYDMTGRDDLHNADQWNVAIFSLQSRQEDLGIAVQNQMVYVQDALSQYNSYVQNANVQITQGMQTLTSVAKGQSLFSTTGSAGMAPVATSLLLGILIGMISMWFMQRFYRERKVK